MRPIQKVITFAAADADSVATAQTPVDGTDITLDGALVSNGAIIDPPAAVTITSADNVSDVTFTVVGYDADNNSVSEDLTNVNANTVTSTTIFSRVIAIYVATETTYTTETVTVGTAEAGIGNGAWWPLDIYTPNQVTTISANITSGTATYSVQYTNEDPFDTSITQLAVAHPVAALTSATADQTAFTTTLMRAVRVNVASGTGALRVNVVQQSTA